VQPDFLLPEARGAAAFAERNDLHARYLFVTAAAGPNTANGGHGAVDAPNLGLVFSRISGRPGRIDCLGGLSHRQ